MTTLTRILPAFLLAGVGLGCGGASLLGETEAPLPAPPPELVFDDCRYLTVFVTHSTDGFGMTEDDALLGGRVAQHMREELSRRGAELTPESADAFWSLRILALHNRKAGGFVFSAMLSSRETEVEAGGQGVEVFTGDDASRSPSFYNGLGYGFSHEIEMASREYVRQADETVLGSARQLCAHEARNRETEESLEGAIPEPNEVPL